MSNNTLPESVKDRIEKDAQKESMWPSVGGHGQIGDWQSNQEIKAGYIRGGTAEALRSMGLVEFAEDLAKELPYPETIFRPINTDDWGKIKVALNQCGISLERLSAQYGREFRKEISNRAEHALTEYNKP